MWSIYNAKVRKARKPFTCDLVDNIESRLDEGELDEEDKVVLQKIRDEKYKVLPGQHYLEVAGRYDGEWIYSKRRIDCEELCKKYELFDND